MDGSRGLARRYHWHSATVKDFTLEPHTGIVGEHKGSIMNLVAAPAQPAQRALLDVVRESPEVTLGDMRKLIMPRHHDVRAEYVDLRRLGAVLAVAYEREFHDFSSLLLLEKLGPRTLQSLALVAEVVHGAPTRFSDPARYSFAHGGKDGHPFPVPLKTYDATIEIMQRSVERAKVGEADKMDGIRRLNRFIEGVEDSHAPVADFDETVARERNISDSLGGRTVRSKQARSARATDQLSLF